MGSTFIRFLLATKKNIQIVNLDKVTYAANFDNLKDQVKDRRYKFVKGDIADKKAVHRAAKGCQAIINYAAETHVDRSILDPDAFIKTDVLGTYNLLEVARDLNIKKFIQISTDEVYGDIPKGYSQEDDMIRPSSPYSASKAGGDMLVLAYHQTFGVPTILTRASNNYGPYQYPEKIIPLFVTNLLENKKVPVYGKGNQVRDWLFVEDHARAIAKLLARGKPGEIYNIGSDRRRNITNLVLTGKILKYTSKNKSSIKYVKDRPGHDTRYAINCDKLKELGWKPQVEFDEGLKLTVEWYDNNRWWWEPLKKGEYLKYYKRQYNSR